MRLRSSRAEAAEAAADEDAADEAAAADKAAGAADDDEAAAAADDDEAAAAADDDQAAASAVNEKELKRQDTRRELRELVKKEKMFMPHTMAAARELRLSRGDCFAERGEAEATILALAETHGYRIRCSERAPDALTYTCKSACQFKQSVRPQFYGGKYHWRVSRVVPHDCAGDDGKTNYNSLQLAAVLVRSAESGLTNNCAKGYLEHFARGKLENRFICRVVAKAKMMRFAKDSQDTTSRLRGYAALVNKSSCGKLSLHMDGDKLYGL